jgi:hypothetical protein
VIWTQTSLGLLLKVQPQFLEIGVGLSLSSLVSSVVSRDHSLVKKTLSSDICFMQVDIDHYNSSEGMVTQNGESPVLR